MRLYLFVCVLGVEKQKKREKILLINYILWITKPMMFSSGLNCNLSFPSCLGYPQDSEELIPKMAREPIILNVYDMVCC